MTLTKPTLMTLDEIAEEHGIPLATIRYWRQVNEAPFRLARIGRRVMARRSDVDAWLASQFAEENE
ncbi:excise [Mycobacterium phage Gaia]|uniref:Excise n=1 Tax=Mycobacterium phage Gaia TaxID=1486472 RepID=A0A068F4K0_9CAUD|nr:excise [Mycobacterium phage Gaia]AID58871.1 excise [Mycobacterium phage Gaia]AYQ99996.1 excisionase [Mycobacterium phage Nebkiss]